MKILLINPPYTSNECFSVSYGEPLGLAYVASSIRSSNRHSVEIIDAVGLAEEITFHNKIFRVGITEKELFDIINIKQFDVIGISATSRFVLSNELLLLGKKLKKIYTSIPIVFGGPDATLYPEKYLHARSCDFIVRGEGESTILQLLDLLENGENIRNIDGISYLQDNGNICNNNLSPPLAIDSIPWPARDMLPIENYFLNKKSRALSVLTSRGCPEKCVFCNIKSIWSQKWRGRCAKDVIDEVEQLIDIYKIEEFHVVDDNFVVNIRRVNEICDEIISRGISIRWTAVPGFYSWLMTKEIIFKLHQSGVRHLQMQIETGSEVTARYIKKKVNLSQVKELVRYAKSIGMSTGSNIIIGFPHETIDDIYLSARNAMSIGFDKLEFIPPEPKMGTEMYKDYETRHLLEQTDIYAINTPVGTEYLKAGELQSIIDNFNNLADKLP